MWFFFDSISLVFLTIRAIPKPSAASCHFKSSSFKEKIFLTNASIWSLLAFQFQVTYFFISWGVRSYIGSVCLRNIIHKHHLTPYTNSAFVWLRVVKNNFSNHTALIGYISRRFSKKSTSSTILANWSFLVGFFWDWSMIHESITFQCSSISQYHSLRIPGSIHKYIFQ